MSKINFCFCTDIQNMGFVSGSFYYLFEYFLYFYHIEKINCFFNIIAPNMKLYKKQFLDMLYDKYDDIDIIIKNIYFIDSIDLINIHKRILYKDIILTDTTSFLKCNFILNNRKKIKKIIVLHSNAITKESFLKFKECFFENNIINLNESGSHFDKNYIKKLYVDIMKKPKKQEDVAYITPKDLKTVHKKDLFSLSYIPQILSTKQILMHCDKEFYIEYKNEKNMILIFENWIPNIHEKFNELIYVSQMLFDFAPRLMIETLYFNKKLTFLNYDSNWIDGASTRYKYISSKNNIEPYILKKNDSILKFLD